MRTNFEFMMNRRHLKRKWSWPPGLCVLGLLLYTLYIMGDNNCGTHVNGGPGEGCITYGECSFCLSVVGPLSSMIWNRLTA